MNIYHLLGQNLTARYLLTFLTMLILVLAWYQFIYKHFNKSIEKYKSQITYLNKKKNSYLKDILDEKNIHQKISKLQDKLNNTEKAHDELAWIIHCLCSNKLLLHQFSQEKSAQFFKLTFEGIYQNVMSFFECLSSCNCGIICDQYELIINENGNIKAQCILQISD